MAAATAPPAPLPDTLPLLSFSGVATASTKSPGASSAASYLAGRPRLRLLLIASAFASVAAVSIALLVDALAPLPVAAAPPPGSPLVTQLGTSLGASPNTEVVMSWAVPASPAWGDAARASAGARWGLAPGALTSAAPAACATYSTTPNQTGYAAYTSPWLCTATVGGLPPTPEGTRVFYDVGDDAHGRSSVRTASTAPAPGLGGMRLALMGDVGTTSDSAATLAAIAASHAAAPFAAALLVGE